MNKNKKAFSLVELSIVLSIIALMLSVMMVSQNISKSSKTLAFVDQINRYKIAYQTFVERFNAVPGDLSSANLFINGATSPGNGDEIIDSNNSSSAKPITGGSESNAAWQHLKLLELVTGEFPGSSGGVKGVNFPECKLTEDCSIHFSGVNIHAKMVTPINYLVTRKLSSSNSSTNHQDYTIDSQTAYKIDSKIDDGLPYEGWVNGYSHGTPCSGNVSTAWSSKKDFNYLSSTDSTCHMIFALNGNFYWK